MKKVTILIDEGTRLLVQGITGQEGRIHTKRMVDYGTKILAGVSPNKGGETVENIPVYNSVNSAIRDHPVINTSIIFVPSHNAADAITEAIESAIEKVVVITEHIPIHDSIKFIERANLRGTKIIGPNCPGIISPNIAKVGIMPTKFFSKGRIGIISRSGTLTYEVANSLTQNGIGQSTVVGIGGDPILGLSMVDVFQMFNEDNETKGIVIIGEIGGENEERLADEIRQMNLSIPIFGYIAGVSAPAGRRMGHAGAIISKGKGFASEKKKILSEAGVIIADITTELPILIKRKMNF